MIDLKLQNSSQKISSEILQKDVIKHILYRTLLCPGPPPYFVFFDDHMNLGRTKEILDFPFSTKNYLTESLPASIFL